MAPLLLVALLAPLALLLVPGTVAGGGATELAAPLRNGLLVALASSLAATLLGTAAGLGLRGGFPGRALAIGLLALPLAVPPVLPGAALLLVAEQTGIGAGRPGAVLWHVLLAAPLVALLVGAALGRVDPALFRAAAASGAPPSLAARVLLRPRLWPAVGGGAALAFALSLGESGVALLLGAEILPVATLPGGIAAGSPVLPLLVALALGVAAWLGPLRAGRGG